MSIIGDSGSGVYRSEDQIVSDLLASWAQQIPDIGAGPTSIIRMWCVVFANSGANFFLGLQLLHDDMFIQTMSSLALQRAGEEFGRPQKAGTLSTGSVTFQGAGGTFIPEGSQVGAPRPAIGDTLVFETTESATLPNPGVPTAPTAADAGSGTTVPAGTYEYAVTFLTAAGETALGAASAPLVKAGTHYVNLTNIPLGGPGTIGRRIYRSVGGGLFLQVSDALTEDNVTTTLTDQYAAGVGSPPDDSTAEQITVTAQGFQTGSDYDVAPGAITALVDVDGDINSVTNAAGFTGGSDPEAVEAFRQALLQWVQSPQSGSTADLINWATSIDGVDSAAVFKNVNLDGDEELGSVVVKISGPNGAVPDSDTIDAVQAYLDSKDLANITIYVGTFTPLSVPVTTQIEVEEGYVLDDVETTVTNSIIAYVNSVPVGGTVFVSGIIHAIFALPGVRTVVSVSLPADDVIATDDEKPVVTADDITITEASWS